jgi:hypothetical protein
MAGRFPPVTVDAYSIRSTRPAGMPGRRASNPSGAGGNAVGAAVWANSAAAHMAQPTIATGTDEIRDRTLAMTHLLWISSALVRRACGRVRAAVPDGRIRAIEYWSSALAALGSTTRRGTIVKPSAVPAKVETNERCD